MTSISHVVLVSWTSGKQIHAEELVGPSVRGFVGVRTISTMPAEQVLWASAMNKGVVPLLHGIDFGSAPQLFGPVRFRVLKDGR